MADEALQIEETTFVVDDITAIVNEAIQSIIGVYSFDQSKIVIWRKSIVELCLQNLAKLDRKFKYLVTCVIMQKNGTGFHAASACYWDNATDGNCNVCWESSTLYCIVNVFGVAIGADKKLE